VKVEISFVVQPTEVPSHHTDRRFSKAFEVEWLGRPMPGERLEVDVGPPVEDHEFTVKGVYWLTPGAGSEGTPQCHVYLERIVIPPGGVEWQDGLDGYVDHCRRRGWEVFP